MYKSSYLLTSESVSEGHPDKVADQVSDAIVDAYLARDPESKVACECLITSGQLIIAGEVTSNACINVEKIARKVVADVGYISQELGFDAHHAIVQNLLHEQSREINESVANGGAGDQGLVFGYATNESPERLPLPLSIAHRLVQAHARLRRDGIIAWLRPDAKSQVSVRYEHGIPSAVEKVVFSTQHDPGIDQEEIREVVIREIISPVINSYLPGGTPEILVNPSGSFTVGGPHGDTGLTGRKIVVDTYGGSCPHGGGAFSGKDPSKVDRSGAYAARYIANHVVAAGLAERCTIQISYAIGVAEPTSLYIDTHQTGYASNQLIAAKVCSLFDLTPQGIIAKLGLKRPIYSQTAAYGHFGKQDLPWEQIDPEIIESLKALHRVNRLDVTPEISLKLRTVPASAIIGCAYKGKELYYNPDKHIWKEAGGRVVSRPFDFTPEEIETAEAALGVYKFMNPEQFRKLYSNKSL